MSLFSILRKLTAVRDSLETKKFKGKKEKREEIVRIRVTAEEKEAFELLGKSMGMSAMVRHAVLDLYMNDFIKDYS